jgi:hypothetical protein
MNPTVSARFQNKINEILGKNISRQLNYEDLEKFTYLDALTKESARIFTIIPLSIRVSTHESVVGGYQ